MHAVAQKFSLGAEGTVISCKVSFNVQYQPQSTQSSNGSFWHTFHHEDKISLGWGRHPPPFITFTITRKVAVYAPAECRHTSPVSSLVKICTLWYQHLCSQSMLSDTSHIYFLYNECFCKTKITPNTKHQTSQE